MKAFLRFIAAFVLIAGARGATAATVPLSFSGATATFLPGSPVSLHVVVTSAAGAQVSVVGVTPDEAAAVLRESADDALATELREKRRALKTVRVHADPAQPVGGTADLGAMRTGLYAVRMFAGDKFIALKLINVTTLGVLTTSTGDAVGALALDLRTMRARGDVSYRRFASGADASETLRGGGDGLTMLPYPHDFTHGGELVMARGDDGAVAFVRPVFYDYRTPGMAGLMQVDRPVYRPGQHVLYRGIIRAGEPGAYTIPSGERRVIVRAPNAKDIAVQMRPIDAYGTFSGDVALPEDADLGTYFISDDGGITSQRFEVQAYKRPEYLLDVSAPQWSPGGTPVTVGVSARYVFGRPAAGMRLHYRAQLNPYYVWWRTGGPFRFAGYSPANVGSAPPVEGDVVAGPDGRATITVPTDAVDAERRLHVEVDGRDASGRTVTATADGLVTPGSFRIELRPRTYFNRAGQAATIDVRTANYGGESVRPGVPVTVTLSRVWYDRGRQTQDAAAPQTVTTDAGGNATVTFTPSEGGYYEARAAAHDEANRPIASTASLWVSSATYDRPYAFTGTTIVAQKASYKAGERATLLVTAPRADADVLVHVRGVRPERVFVRHIAGTAGTIDVDVPSDVPQFNVDVTVPTPKGPILGSAIVYVAPKAHALNVVVRPDKPKYAPGDAARFAVEVHDADGKPARAELALAVVDDALLAVQRDDALDPYGAFYLRGTAYRPGATSWSSLDEPVQTFLYPYPLQMIGRATAAQAAVPAPPPPTPAAATDQYSVHNAQGAQPSFAGLRTDFRETAYWTPSAITGADGTATVAFRWPDSLTSYTATGVAVTQQTDIGRGTGNALVTKDFLVRVAAPRFLRRADTARVGAIAQGTKSAHGALLRFSAPALGVADDTRSVRFDDNATGNTAWTVHGEDLGAATLQLAGTSGTLRDGLRTSLPVESQLAPDHARAAGTLSSAPLALAVPRDGEAGDLRIDISPSVVAQLAAGVRLLQVYPYYCVEQTMSSALPAIFVERLQKRANLPRPDGPAAASVAKRAVDRLVQLQHPDGSWGWWEKDAANPFMSAYALYGLTELGHNGYAVPPATLDRGARSVAVQAAQRGDTLGLWSGPQAGSEWNTRAFMLFALADAAPARVDRALLAETDTHAAALNPYALATLGLAHVALGDRTGAQPLLADLLKRVHDDGTYAHWEGGGWHYHWEDDPIEATAYALRFVHAMTPSDVHVARAVQWLRTHQRGSWFETTKDTAAAIAALSETIDVDTGELTPHETVRVLLDGRPLKTLRIDQPVLAANDASIVVPAAQLRRGGTVAFAREGTGAVYWSTDWTRYVAHAPPAALDPDLDVRRTYTSAHGTTWSVGDQVDVDVVVRAKSAVQFVAIEDPLPAGLEYQPVQGSAGAGWSGLQFFDDRVVFFADRMSPGLPLHLRYTLRATTAGTFTAPAPTAYAMYGPPVSAFGETATVTVR